MINVLDLISLFETEFEEIEKGVLSPQSNFKKEIRWDSMNSLIFIIAVEVKFGVLISDEEISKLNTINELCECINKRINE
jgi:acyl carrier protein